jgi:hypothetical protein
MALTFSNLTLRSEYLFSLEMPCPNDFSLVTGGNKEWSSIVYCLAGQTMVGLSVKNICDNAWKQIENDVHDPVRQTIRMSLENAIMACATKVE